MKKIIVIITLTMAILSLNSCGTFASMDSESAYRTGYNLGVILNGGDSSEFLKE